MIKKLNIDSISKKIKKEVENIKKIIKIDGITLEIEASNKKVKDKVIEDLKIKCKELKLNPINIEENNEEENKLALQFPELENIFTEEEQEKLYEDNFKWLIANLKANDPNHKVTKEVILKSRDVIIRESINIYFRSFINPYKHNISEFIDNEDYIKNLQVLFNNYVQNNVE